MAKPFENPVSLSFAWGGTFKDAGPSASRPRVTRCHRPRVMGFVVLGRRPRTQCLCLLPGAARSKTLDPRPHGQGWRNAFGGEWHPRARQLPTRR